MTVTKRLPARFIDMRPLTRRKAAPQAGRLLRLAAFALVLSGCGAAPATPLAHAASGAAAEVPLKGRARQELAKGTGATKSGFGLVELGPQAL